MKKVIRVRTPIAGLWACCCLALLSSSMLQAQSAQLYRSTLIKGMGTSPSKYLEVVIPSEFSKGQVLSLSLVFVSSSNPSQVEGSMTQDFSIQTPFQGENARIDYPLLKKGTVVSKGKPGLPSLLDNLALKKTQSFAFVFNGALTDDLVLQYPLASGESGKISLSYVGKVSDQQPSSPTAASTPSKSLYDKLLGEDPPAKTAEAPSKESENPWDMFTPEVEVDVDALLEKREYEVFVLKTDHPVERNGHLIQVGFYVPTSLKEGSVVRVLAVKKLASSGKVVGMVEMDYYVKRAVPDKQLPLYYLADMAPLSRKMGESVDLLPGEKTAFEAANFLSLVKGDSFKILSVSHGDQTSTAFFEGVFSF